MHRERSDELWFASSFQTEVKLQTGIDYFFNHFAQLIDLDRKNAAILTFVAELSDRVLKREIDRFHAVAEQILKPDNERET